MAGERVVDVLVVVASVDALMVIGGGFWPREKGQKEENFWYAEGCDFGVVRRLDPVF